MMFSSLEYLLFFVIVLGLLAVIKGNALKKYFLLVAHIFFLQLLGLSFCRTSAAIDVIQPVGRS